MKIKTLAAFSGDEAEKAKILLATQVATMMGRKLEEGDWNAVYCEAKGIPQAGWSNLHLDVNHNGLGVEQKLLRCPSLRGKPIKSVCGTVQMHPAATRSIRIDSLNAKANVVMKDVFRQYAELIQARTDRVRDRANARKPDMRVGWLLWEDTLSEFLYFEERMEAPDPEKYFAEWSLTPARGARKASKSLWIYDRDTRQKRYSVTTHAGVKIQPYFDVPPPSDPNLYYFRVQSEPVDSDTINIWVAASTAHALQKRLGALSKERISAAILKLVNDGALASMPTKPGEDRAIPIAISLEAHSNFMRIKGKSDEHRAQLLLKALG